MSTANAGWSPIPFVHKFIPAGDPPTLPQPPAVVLLHGTGGNEDDLLPLGRSLAPGAPLLSPRGQVLEHGMPRFFRRLAEGVFDEPDLIRRTHELADFLTTAAAEYGFDPDHLTAIGYSNGANIAASLMLLRPEVLKRAVLLRAMVPLVPGRLPDLSGREVLLASGIHDPILPLENARRLAAMLRGAGAAVDHLELPAGHQLTSPELTEARTWLRSRSAAPGT